MSRKATQRSSSWSSFAGMLLSRIFRKILSFSMASASLRGNGRRYSSRRRTVWRIGIDEAGYGPNFGPLVMTAAACRVPDELADGDLWEVLDAAVCRCSMDKERPRPLLVDDSKKVYRAG